MNRARGDLLREAEQESRREDVSTGGDVTEPESRCPDKVQTNLDPFGETSGPTREPSSEPAGETQEMELSYLRKKRRRSTGKVSKSSGA